MKPKPMLVGWVMERGVRCKVSAYVRDWCLFLERAPVDGPADQDVPITLVTREGLLRLSRGPFEKGFVEDHL